MDRLTCMRTFVAVAETGGFSLAARRLAVSPPLVTRAVASLEAHLGVPLLTRSTRKVRLTEAGAGYLEDCRHLLAELDEMERSVSGRHGEPRGLLALTASVMFGRLHVTPILIDFLAQHPAVNARTLLLDRVVDLIEEDLDLAVRIAKLSDSSLTAIRVGEVRRVLCASPAYLRKHGVPRRPEDLAEHDAVVFAPERSSPAWSFERGGKQQSVRPRARLWSNASEVGIQAALQGRAVTRLLSYMVTRELRAGQLRVLLPEHEPEPLPVHLVIREGRRAPARVRTFVDYAVPRLRSALAVALD